MLTVYKTIDNKLTVLEKPEKGCWISVVEPTAEEISYLRDTLGILPEFIRSALDEEETAHVDAEPDENQTLIMFDASVEDSTIDTVSFTTMPLGVIFTEPYIVTIAQRRHLVLEEMAAGMMRGLQTNMKTRFFLRMMMRVTSGFLSHLRRIDKLSSMTEQELHRSMRNQELLQLMGLQKSLVYFSSSLKANDAIFQRVSRGKLIKMYEEDEDLMDLFGHLTSDDVDPRKKRVLTDIAKCIIEMDSDSLDALHAILSRLSASLNKEKDED
jgi:magnesium transporter